MRNNHLFDLGNGMLQDRRIDACRYPVINILLRRPRHGLLRLGRRRRPRTASPGGVRWSGEGVRDLLPSLDLIWELRYSAPRRLLLVTVYTSTRRPMRTSHRRVSSTVADNSCLHREMEL